jgi:hypothetical protein
VTAFQRGSRRLAPVACLLVLLAAAANATACGDVHADLITGPAAVNIRCTADSDCAAPTPRCETASGRCVQCLGVGFVPDCPNGKACAQPSASCVTACTTGTECSSRLCDATIGLCGACKVGTDCPTTHPHCDSTSGTCRECGQRADCLAHDERPFCVNGSCVECETSAACEAQEECSLELGECARACSDDGDCIDDDPKCHRSFGFCVGCIVDADCGGALCRRWECTR